MKMAEKETEKYRKKTTKKLLKKYFRIKQETFILKT